MKKVILDLVMAMLSSALSTLYFVKGETLLGVVWALIAILDGVSVIINHNER
jgi:type III secretory pathway component EscV